MTIQNDTSRAVYIADGKTSSFVVPFRFFERQLNVYFDDSAEPLAADDYAASASETASGGEIVFLPRQLPEPKLPSCATSN